MLNEIIKEQKEIIKQVKAGQNQVALDIAGVGLKVGQSNYWLRQQVKENLKSIRTEFPQLIPLLNNFFSLMDKLYDAQAAVLGAKQYLNQSDLHKLDMVLAQLAQDKTSNKLNELVKAEPSRIGRVISTFFISKLVETYNETLTAGKELKEILEKRLVEKKM